jgi:hypothetical protein
MNWRATFNEGHHLQRATLLDLIIEIDRRFPDAVFVAANGVDDLDACFVAKRSKEADAPVVARIVYVETETPQPSLDTEAGTRGVSV